MTSYEEVEARLKDEGMDLATWQMTALNLAGSYDDLLEEVKRLRSINEALKARRDELEKFAKRIARVQHAVDTSAAVNSAWFIELLNATQDLDDEAFEVAVGRWSVGS